nr:hypothetical protein CFP56_07588 [Quercus suber]
MGRFETTDCFLKLSLNGTYERSRSSCRPVTCSPTKHHCLEANHLDRESDRPISGQLGASTVPTLPHVQTGISSLQPGDAISLGSGSRTTQSEHSHRSTIRATSGLKLRCLGYVDSMLQGP